MKIPDFLLKTALFGGFVALFPENNHKSAKNGGLWTESEHFWGFFFENTYINKN